MNFARKQDKTKQILIHEWCEQISRTMLHHDDYDESYNDDDDDDKNDRRNSGDTLRQKETKRRQTES